MVHGINEAQVSTPKLPIQVYAILQLPTLLEQDATLGLRIQEGYLMCLLYVFQL